mmetsp:Transcript_23123/g.38751  ORF Transcript_23123/g.38751 Transcript_23123/m.38751 type:complete len:386 (+) Transcript_23123:97-1254(+)
MGASISILKPPQQSHQESKQLYKDEKLDENILLTKFIHKVVPSLTIYTSEDPTEADSSITRASWLEILENITALRKVHQNSINREDNDNDAESSGEFSAVQEDNTNEKPVTEASQTLLFCELIYDLLKTNEKCSALCRLSVNTRIQFIFDLMHTLTATTSFFKRCKRFYRAYVMLEKVPFDVYGSLGDTIMGIVSDQCRICSTKSASSNPITQSNSSPDVQHAWKRLYSYFLRHICSTAYLFKPPSSSRLSNSAQSTSSRSEQEKHSSNSLTEYSGEAQEGEGAMASPGKKSSKLALIHWNEGDGYEILVAKFPHLNLRDYNNSNNNYDNNSFNNNSSLHGNSARHVNDTTQEGVKGNSTAGRGRPVEKSRSCNSSRNNTPRRRT